MAPSHKPEIIVIDDDSDDLDPFSDIDSPDVSIIDISENMDLMPPNRKPPHDARTLCKDNVRAVFPDICPDYLEKLANEHNNNSAAIIGMILDSQEKGEMYPARPHENPLKRKRSQVDNSDDGSGDEKDKRPDEGITRAEAIKANIAEPGYRNNTREKSYVKISTKLLASDFSKVPIPVIRKYLSKNAGSVLEAHIAMNNALRNWNDDEPPWVDKAVCSPGVEKFESGRIEDLDMSEYNEFEKLAIAELRAARQFRNIEIENASAKAREEHDFNRAKATGQTDDCGCCFEECVINRMIHCDGENAHRFCRDCMKSQVEANIGLSKHELTCMSMDGCSAGFSLAQRKLFLDKATRTAFERLEQEAALRMAGIENLETCPFCPYAAEYPPPEVNKEFRCDNPGCEKVSCRLCRKESHIPKTCAEYAAEHGLEARHILEEAMSEAVIRKCNNCKHPYMKSEGCNKVVCTRCGTKQCYVCRKTITDYKHFNDTSRGGQRGQCPLFDRIDRHEREIQEAEAETRKKVEKDNPGLTADDLKIKSSEYVSNDEKHLANQIGYQRQMLQQARFINQRARQINRHYIPPPHPINHPPPIAAIAQARPPGAPGAPGAFQRRSRFRFDRAAPVGEGAPISPVPQYVPGVPPMRGPVPVAPMHQFAAGAAPIREGAPMAPMAPMAQFPVGVFPFRVNRNPPNPVNPGAAISDRQVHVNRRMNY